MNNLLLNRQFREELSDLFKVDVSYVICFFFFAVICAYVFVEIFYEKYIKNSTLKVSIVDYFADFQQRQGLQLAN